MDALEFRLLNDFQRDFPLASRPYARVGDALGVTENVVLDTLASLQRRGVLSRVGAVFRPHAIGASLLAALEAPPNLLGRIAQRISLHRAVTHNYAREHRLNLWFVVTALDRERVEAVVQEIEGSTGLAVLKLPLVDEIHVDLGFPLDAPCAKPEVPSAAHAPAHLSAQERRLAVVIEDGLPLKPRPYADLAVRSGLSEHQVIDMLESWRQARLIRRLGVIVRHRALGFRANAMCVWDVPEGEAREIGAQLAREPAVTLCYIRARAQPRWRYNLYCMIHGRERHAVEREIARLVRAGGLARFAHEVLFSRRCYKQTGARYAGCADG